MTITKRKDFTLEEQNDIDYESTFTNLEQGKVVRGVIVKIDQNEALVDVGGKSEGILPLKELTNTNASMKDLLELGQELELYILKEPNEDGQVTLSRRRVEQAKGWTAAQDDFDAGNIVKGKIIDTVKGGLLVELHKIRGFVPSSQLRNINIENIDELIGTELPLKIIEINPKKNKLILSHRKALEDEKSPIRAEVVSSLEEGSVITGRIVRLVEFGAFVDVGGIDGLLPISEISWKRIAHPNEVLKAGEEITVKVFKIDRELNRVSLSLKRMQEDPWEAIKDSFHKGDKIKGIVTKLTNFGAFIEVCEGIEALLPISEIPDGENINLDRIMPIGTELEATIKKFEPEERKINLTLKEYSPEEDEEEIKVENVENESLNEENKG
jgi:ribosomal protein S1